MKLGRLRHPYQNGLVLNTEHCQRCGEPQGREAGRRHLACRKRKLGQHRVPAFTATCMACCKPKLNEPGRVHAACAVRLARRQRRLEMLKVGP